MWKHYLLYTFMSSSPRNCSRSPIVQASIQKRWAPDLPRSFRNCLITKQSAQYISCNSSISFITVTLSNLNSRSFHVQISLLTIMKWTFWTRNYFVYPYLTSFSKSFLCESVATATNLFCTDSIASDTNVSETAVTDVFCNVSETAVTDVPHHFNYAKELLIIN